MSPHRRTWGALAGLLCGLLALGPALRPGYLLVYDMVFVPRLELSARTLGVDGSVPRAVPNDAVVALLSQLAPGWVVQKVLLLAVFVGVGAGVAGLVRTRVGGVAAAVAACWNPYVAERLAIGHWGFLLGYACLPWVASAAAACRDGRPYGRCRLATALVLVALTGSTGSVLALIVAACVLLLPSAAAAARGAAARLTDLVWVAVVALLANAPWWYPFLVVSADTPADSGGVEAFMSRADTPYGVLPSLLTGGGIWNKGVWFDERMSTVVAGVGLVGVTVSVAFWVRSTGWRRHPATGGLAVAGVIGLLTAGLSSVVGGKDLVTWIVTSVPGGGLMRDSQKFVALWVILLAVCVGTLTEIARAAMSRRQAGRAGSALLALALAAWPVATLPSMAWGATGRWDAAQYPASQLDLAARIDRLPAGSVAVFPWTLYRRYAWNDDIVLLDPWQRLISREVVVNDDLPLSSRTVRGESSESRQIGDALAGGTDVTSVLRRVGVRYVLVLTDQPPAPGVPDVSRLDQIVQAQDVALYDLGAGGVAPVAAPGGYRYAGLAAGGTALVVVAIAWVVAGVRHPSGDQADRSVAHATMY
ncbi:hypothetical protein PZ938_10255 [Luteipulveratus sp. YIM 133132]|uniref:hypothetical protein n=1 Tax=Luteipulveratus flavus TaxID=3031728 RepID=UPI0023B0AAA2|nr:hypothetical protein [Luteipulveratus sp. YIM 133132]MDE9365985.1 hypothetical protein [Luteipulveratus sp. YIM 133132]